MKIFTFCFLLLLLSFSLSAQELIFELVTEDLDYPTTMTNAGDERLFVTEQNGLIQIVQPDGSINTTPFLDITSLTGAFGERGLLGMVFSPNYSTNGEFYINYTNSDGNTVIARYTVSENQDVANTTGEILLTITQPYSNHNGGSLAFGPDGYLYISMGDGGSGGDPQGNGQNTNSLLGKMLRIDVDAETYEIPTDNPFVGTDGEDEIWAYGLRNAWKFSFDMTAEDIWIADVGQNSVEEINKQPASSAGLNYGWRCYEGDQTYNTSGCPDASNLTFPVVTYSRSGGRCSVTGGYVYRGNSYPDMQGKYYFSDYCSGIIGVVHENNSMEWLNNTGISVTGFGEDYQKELYVFGSGSLYKITTETFGVNDLDLPTVELYPNPAHDYLKVKGFVDIDFAKIYTNDGKLISTLKSFQDNAIDVRSLHSGVYLIQLQSGKYSYSFKFMKK